MGFLLGSLLPLVGGLFHGGAGADAGAEALTAASNQMLASQTADEVSQVQTQQAMSERSSKFANLYTVANEKTRETAEYDEYVLSVQSAEQNVLQKQMKMVDNASIG